jgi:hypothetical protein
VTTLLHGDTLYRAVVIIGGPQHFAAMAADSVSTAFLNRLTSQ